MNNKLQITDAMWGGWIGKLLYVPLLNILVLLYVYIPGNDLGLAIIALTILIRLILQPSYRNSLKSQHDIQKVQPYIDKIKIEYKDDQKRQSEEIMKIYKEHKINLFGSCLPLIIQLPILLALYRVFWAGLNTESLIHLYGWFPHPPVELHTIFLQFTGVTPLMVDLTSRNIYLAVLAGLAQLGQSWLTLRYTAKSQVAGPQKMTNQAMLYLFPVMTFGIALTLPSALGLYWATTTIALAVQQIIIYRSFAREERAVIQTTHHGNVSDSN